ncbi:FAD-dependent oxidoreductase [Streptomyces albus subsp. chlorinus]|uniref:FAD-dependent oxidoreductase n=1 Tax=Streptomyces albus TaxID=1888 RepID=UPI00156E6570|nr:FAD-dependent oxidoreductase [Streptomyces albus]NSC19905.1 FAD-dependent oxidoreductase [Streptomyces albus subsp. chlorinus]
METKERAEAVVVGAGPTGLLAASELALQGIEVVVLDRLTEPDHTIKAGSINIASAEILDRRGLLGEAEAVQRTLMERVGMRVPALAPGTLPAFPAMGHFGGIFFDASAIDQSDPVLSEHTAAAGGIAVPQAEVELILRERCAARGVEIRRGVTVTSLEHTGASWDDDADVLVETSAGTIMAGWVVAADGGRSTVRKLLEIDFVGTEPTLVGYQAVVRMQPAEALSRGWTWTPRGVYASGPVPGRVLVARFGEQPADKRAEVSVEELQEVLRDVTGHELTITGAQGRITRWSDNSRYAARYRRGRVLLAGDAAHVHPPFSGQGLNLGFGDAVNLGWKLAATICGTAPAGLLDSYESERQRIAAQVLDWTRAQVSIMRGDPQSAQMRGILQDELLPLPAVATRMLARTAGITQRYEVTANPRGAEGTLVGNGLMGDGSRFAEYAHDGGFVLVDRTVDARHAELAKTWTPGVTIVRDSERDAPSILVRPDGIIAWEGGDDTDQERLAAALRRWAGRR